MAATQHRAGEGYSERNPVPTVQKHEKEMATRREEADKQAADQAAKEKADEKKGSSGEPGKKTGAQEKAEMMEKMSKPKEPPNKRLQIKGERTVKDPVTGKDVIIHDAAMQDFSGFHIEDYDPKGEGGPNQGSLQPIKDEKMNQADRTSPIPSGVSNICLQAFPPPVSKDSMTKLRDPLKTISILFGVGLLAIWIFTAFGHGFLAFFWRSTIIGTVAFVALVKVGVTANQLEKEIERVRFEMHRQRAAEFSPPTPESTEWLNAFIATFMKLLPPDFFFPIADQIEDVMQASLPGFIEAVKVADIGQGTNPFRIIAMRALPDQPGDKGYPKEEWIDQGEADRKRAESEGKEDDKSKGKSEIGKAEDFTDQSGDYVNFEVAFAYKARPGQSDRLRAHNIHLMIEFFLGIWNWTRFPIPIWIQVEGLVGTVRLRIQMIPEAPYVRNLTFTMMGVPKVEVSAKPMLEKIPNILDLPLVSGFVQSSIGAACAEYVAPKSMTMNIQEMLSGAAATESTHATGVIVVTIHHATNLSSQDSNGYSDPYMVVAYAKFGKPLYSTRIIMEDLNPVFEETAFLLISEDEVKAREDISIMLWDSDEHSADDLIGRVQVPVSEIIAKPNHIVRRTDALKGYEDADEMSGELTWSIGYFAKSTLEPFRQKDQLSDAPHEPIPAGQPAGPKMPSKSMVVSPTNTPPSPEKPSGILSVIVHHINNLERANLKGASKDREGSSGQDVTEPSDQDDNLPSGYCEIIVNDNMVYKTRTKQYTTSPFFNAGTEVFVRNWRETVVRIAVRDSRVREKDPLLGVINIDLEELFNNSKTSQVTQLFSLQDGVGFGRAQVSLLFQPVDADLPKNLLGWDTATLEILSPLTLEVADEKAHELGKKKLSIITSEDTLKVSPRAATIDGGRVTWKVKDNGEPLRLPLFERYKSAVAFQIGSPDVLAVLWLQTMVDEEEKEIRIPLIAGKRLKRLRQHFVNDQLKKTHDYEIVGYLRCRVRLDPGLDPDHVKYVNESAVRRHTFEAFDNTEGQAEQADRNSHANDDGVIDKHEQKAINRAHTKALHSRHRGAMQFQVVRTSVWMKEGMTRRVKSVKNKVTGKVIHEQEVPTEGRS